MVAMYLAFKVAKMREAIMEDQDEFLMRNAECADVDMHTNNSGSVATVATGHVIVTSNSGVNVPFVPKISIEAKHNKRLERAWIH